MTEIVIEGWTHLMEYIDGVNLHKTSHDVLFRGQTNSNWELLPSLSRIVRDDTVSESKAEYYERYAILDFRAQVYNTAEKFVYSDNAGPIDYLIDMQHFYCPTRLLDWSFSPYVALYFAVCSGFDCDASLFIWEYAAYNRKMQETYPMYSKMKISDAIYTNDYTFVNVIMGWRRNARLQAQQGTFSISNNLLKSHCELISGAFDKGEDNGLYKLVIPAALKMDFLSRLKLMNIVASSLFPGLEGIGRSITDDLYLRKWRESLTVA